MKSELEIRDKIKEYDIRDKEIEKQFNSLQKDDEKRNILLNSRWYLWEKINELKWVLQYQ